MVATLAVWLRTPISLPLSFDGAPQDFELSIDDSLPDPAGFSMALVAERILAKGWMPDGVESCEGYRVFRYCLA